MYTNSIYLFNSKGKVFINPFAKWSSGYVSAQSMTIYHACICIFMWIREERLDKYQYLYYWKKFFESKNYTIWENILKVFWMEVEFLKGFKCYQILRVVKRCSAFKVKHEFGKKKRKKQELKQKDGKRLLGPEAVSSKGWDAAEGKVAKGMQCEEVDCTWIVMIFIFYTGYSSVLLASFFFSKICISKTK